MAYLVGTDEAGYGPNLGPLVVAASVWHVPEGDATTDLYARLEGMIADGGSSRTMGALAIADSKKLYQPGKGIALLERGVLAALAVIGVAPRWWREAWAALAPVSRDVLDELPWHRDYDCRLPLEADGDDVAAASRAIAAGLAARGVRLADVRCRAIFPRTFNTLAERLGSKGAALTQWTLELVGECIQALDGPVVVVCDKHGGRNRYAAAAQQFLTDELVEIIAEGRQESVYRFGGPQRRVELRFRAKGEGWLPAALASMTAKYVRELAMKAFNDFWRQQVPGLRPTAGYPVDAARFRREIARRRVVLGIDEAIVWRQR